TSVAWGVHKERVAAPPRVPAVDETSRRDGELGALEGTEHLFPDEPRRAVGAEQPAGSQRARAGSNLPAPGGARNLGHARRDQRPAGGPSVLDEPGIETM